MTKTRSIRFSRKRRRGGRKTVKRRGGRRRSRVNRRGGKRRSRVSRGGCEFDPDCPGSDICDRDKGTCIKLNDLFKKVGGRKTVKRRGGRRRSRVKRRGGRRRSRMRRGGITVTTTCYPGCMHTCIGKQKAYNKSKGASELEGTIDYRCRATCGC